MSTWKLVVAALTVSLAFCGAANAATLTLDLKVIDPGTEVPLDAAAVGAISSGDMFTVGVFATVSGNEALPGSGAGGGINSASWTIYTPDTDGVALPNAQGPFANNTATNWDASFQRGSRQDFATTPAIPQADALDPDTDVDNVGTAVYQGLNGTGEVGADGVQFMICKSVWTMAADGPATIAIFADPRADYVDWFSGSLATPFGESNVISGAPIVVGPAGPSGIPTVADVTEGDWGGDPGWNTLTRQVTLAIDPNGLSGTTKILVDPGTGFVQVGTDDNPVLTIGDLAAAGGLPAYPGATWDLKVDVGGTESEVGSIFIPEPTTIALVSCGVIALFRRRRRA